ncbi:low molecular weight protein-tyrosine-phosphatase [Nitrincola sp.]|uniref:low molecular weight protein-tyrosine-phosphatase n=1 Tax=Nitrincola sp. TaxID=1926584 RepID=UPI003A9475C1
MKFDNILVVCIGNICRSPTGELMLRNLCPSKKVHSAGLGALVDKPMDATALELADEHGLDGKEHKARQLTRELAQEADLILVMEQKHIKGVIQLAPEAGGKTFLFNKWAGNGEIPDPYRQQRPAFEHVYSLMEQGAAGWAKVLSR